MQDLIRTISAEIRGLELRIGKLKKARELLGEGPKAPKKIHRTRRRYGGAKGYREYILEILKDQGGLTTFEITRELEKIGVKPVSKNPQTVIASCLRTMVKQGAINREQSERGILNLITLAEGEAPLGTRNLGSFKSLGLQLGETEDETHD